MCYFLLPALLLYCNAFAERAPTKLCTLPIFLLLILLSLRFRRLSLPVLMALTLHLLSNDAMMRAHFSSSLEESGIIALYGTVESKPSVRRNRDAGFRLNAKAAVDTDGSVYSAKGIIYVISDLTDIDKGDDVRLDGAYNSKGYFKASSTNVLSRSPFGGLRRAVLPKIYEALRFEGGDLSAFLLLGSDENGATEVVERARLCGLSHLLALSGMHLSILSMMIERPLCKVIGEKRARAFAISFLIFFTYLSGWRASLLRALIYRVLMLKFSKEHAFSLSLVLMLALSPCSVDDLSSVLGFVSLSGMLLLSPRLESALLFIVPLPRRWIELISSSISAMSFSIPLLMEYFGTYQLLAIATGVILTPLIELYMLLSVLVLLLPPLSSALSLLYKGIMLLLELFSKLEGQSDYLGYKWLLLAIFLLLALEIAINRVQKPKRSLTMGIH